jgi:hypothetical protein
MGGAISVVAHGPLDHSARLTLRGDGLEVGLTLGPDLVRAALAHGGLPLDDTRKLLASRGPSGHGTVSPEVFATLVELRGPAGALAPTGIIVLTDGLEYLFVGNYPRPPLGPITFHPRYLDGVSNVPPGGLEFIEEGQGRLAHEPLKSKTPVSLTLPATATTVASVTTAVPEINATAAAPAPADLATETAGIEAGMTSGWWIWAVGVAGTGAVVVMLCRRQRGVASRR